MGSLVRWTRIAVWPLQLLWYNLYLWFVVPLRHALSPGLLFEISKGDVFVVRSPLATTVLTHWKAPTRVGTGAQFRLGWSWWP